MESERHAFMRRLLELCIATGFEFEVDECIDARKPENGLAIEALEIWIEERRAVGYWDGERHEVQL